MEIIQKKVKELSPLPNNPKKHTRKQVQQIAKSIQEYGWTTPLVVNKDFVVIAGNGRLKAAKLLKLGTVPVVVVEFNGKENKYAIEDNLLGMLTGWEKQELKLCLDTIDTDDICGVLKSDLVNENKFYQKYCDFVKHTSARHLDDILILSATKSNVYFEGKELHELKQDFSNIEYFATLTAKLVKDTLGNIAGACIVPAPAGHHKEKNFAIETAKRISEILASVYRSEIV